MKNPNERQRYFCPVCQRVAEYEPYYKRGYCTFCSWRSDQMTEKAFKRKMHNGFNKPQKGAARGAYK
jgi:hypothetical protein